MIVIHAEGVPFSPVTFRNEYVPLARTRVSPGWSSDNWFYNLSDRPDK